MLNSNSKAKKKHKHSNKKLVVTQVPHELTCGATSPAPLALEEVAAAQKNFCSAPPINSKPCKSSRFPLRAFLPSCGCNSGGVASAVRVVPPCCLFFSLKWVKQFLDHRHQCE